MESWRIVEDLPMYEVSDRGRIRNINTGRILRTFINEKGYETVSLRCGGRQYHKKVHRLVAEAFCERYYDDDIYVYHRDRDRLNNEADNLEWRHYRDIKRRAYRRREIKQYHKMIPVLCRETGRAYESIDDCSQAMGISRYAISKCINHRSRHTKEGYHFERLD